MDLRNNSLRPYLSLFSFVLSFTEVMFNSDATVGSASGVSIMVDFQTSRVI